MPRRLPSILFFASTVLVAATAAPALAASSSVSDPRGDAAAGVDIVRATYVNGERSVQFRLKVRDLGSRGSFRLSVAAPRTDEAMVAEVTRGAVKWGFQTLTTTKWIGCNGVSHRWLETRDIVRVSVPRTCVSRQGYDGALYMQATSNNGYGDFVDSRVVERG